MNCSSCGRSNQPDAAFCVGCGQRLELLCGQCTRANPPDSAFCGGCGTRLDALVQVAATAPSAADMRSLTPRHLAEKILRDRASLEGERRNVTVLFADAVGFTPMSERMDEEEVYDLMQGCLTRMMEAVHRYEGTITNFTGDGVMALFGAPIAHEDAARRAVVAGLEVQRSLQEYAADIKGGIQGNIECRFRVGLNTGPVVVGKISDNLDMDYTALGDTVNLAARMEQLAEPGAVYLTENTYRAVRDFMDCEPLGALTVKGKSEPVVAYRAVREKPDVRTRLQAAAERGLTPFIGRDQELNVIQGYFDQVKRGHGQVLFISGDAGLGKSRLLYEFRRSLEGQPVRWLEGHCISYGRKIPYLPISELVKRNFGVEEGDNDTRIINRVEERVSSWSERARETVPYLRYLLNVDPGDARVASMDPVERRAGILDGLRALLVEETREQPIVAIVEDLHWIDENSEDALRALVDVVQSAPVLMILNYRPGYSPSLGERTYYSRIALQFLPEDASEAIARSVLQAKGLPEALLQLITGKAEGNPFYVEEVTKSLMESGVLTRDGETFKLAKRVEDIRVPDTIQEVILSRIDRLETEARGAIQLASVIGREFTVRLLERISEISAKLDDLLVDLKALELIYEKSYFPELSYMFKHALTHDVAYSTLLLERRRGLHRMVGAAIEELYADRLQEHYETLAYHYEQGEQWDKALEYLDKAGDKAAAQYANHDALHYYDRAISVSERLEDPGTAAGVSQRAAMVRLGIGDFTGAADEFDRCLELTRRAGLEENEAMVLALKGVAQLEAHDFPGSLETLTTALDIAREDDYEAQFMALSQLTARANVLNLHDEAGQHLAAAQEIRPRVNNPFAEGMLDLFASFDDNWKGRLAESLAYIRRWRSTAEESNVALLTVFNLWQEAVVLGGMGEYERALGVLENVEETAIRVGEIAGRARALNTSGWIFCELQDHERAMVFNTRSIEVAEEIKALSRTEIQANARLNLGDSLLMLGQLEEAEEQFKWVEQVVRRPQVGEEWMLWRYSQHHFASYGDLWLVRGDAERALEYAAECLLLAERSESRKNLVKARRLRGRALIARGRPDEAEPELTSALQIALEVGNPPQTWKTHAAIGELRLAQGRQEEARAAYAEALALIEAVAAKLTDEALRQMFVSSAHVAGIRAAAGR